MNYIELISAMLGGGVLTTVFTRILPNKDKKLDFISKTQTELLQRQNELEKKLDKQTQEYIELMKKNTVLKEQIAVLKERLTVFEKRCSTCLNHN